MMPTSAFSAVRSRVITNERATSWFETSVSSNHRAFLYVSGFFSSLFFLDHQRTSLVRMRATVIIHYKKNEVFFIVM